MFKHPSKLRFANTQPGPGITAPVSACTYVCTLPETRGRSINCQNIYAGRIDMVDKGANCSWLCWYPHECSLFFLCGLPHLPHLSRTLAGPRSGVTSPLAATQRS